MEHPATISIDLDKKCTRCRRKGATPSGLCLDCISKNIEKGMGMPKKSGSKPVTAEGAASQAGQILSEAASKKIEANIMLNKNNFEIGKLAPPAVEGRTALSCVLIRPNCTVVTDGHFVIEVTGAECAISFLPFEDLMPQTEFEQFTMPAEEAVALSKLFVKSDTPDGNILAMQPENSKGICAFALRQARKEKVFRMDRPKEDFPNYELLFDNVKSEIASVSLDLNLLIPLLRSLKSVSGGLVRIGIYGTEEPVRFDCIDNTTKQSARALLMPMKE